MKKKFIAKHRKKQKRKLKIILYLLLFILLLLLSFSLSKKINIPMTNEEFLRKLIYQSNHNIDYRFDKRNIVTKVMKFFTNINLDNPATILNHNYIGLTEVSEDLDNLEKLQETSKYVSDPYPENVVTKPRVYIYNTHQLENYQASNLAEYNVQPTVMMGSYILREKLNNLGVSSMVEEGNVTDVLQMNNWSYSYSYEVTKMFIKDAMEKNPTLEYFIDFHRDSVNRDITAMTIDDKNYARILFIVGMENPNYAANLSLTTKINNLLDERYPGLSRGIYKKEGPGVNGVYNQNLSPNTILVEMGGVGNTIDEVLNSTEVFAQVLYTVIGEDQ